MIARRDISRTLRVIIKMVLHGLDCILTENAYSILGNLFVCGMDVQEIKSRSR